MLGVRPRSECDVRDPETRDSDSEVRDRETLIADSSGPIVDGRSAFSHRDRSAFSHRDVGPIVDERSRLSTSGARFRLVMALVR